MQRTGLLSFLLLLSVTLFSQLSQPSFDTQKKFTFFKTWNWLKYYHPDFATGKVKADSVFLQYLPEVDKASDNAVFNRLITHILGQLSIPVNDAVTVKQFAWPNFLVQNLDTFWLPNNELLSPAIKTKLRQVFKNRFTGEVHYYMSNRGYESDIPHEPAYPFPDTVNIPYEYRMLTLAKIQGAIDYMSPNKYVMDQTWTTVVLRFIPLFAASDSRQDYETCLMRIAATLNDSHTWPFYEDMKYKKRILSNPYYPPFDYQVLGNKMLVTNIIVKELCDSANILQGDLISSLDGIAVADRIKELSGLLSVSNKNLLLYKMAIYTNNLPFKASKSSISITVERNGKTHESVLNMIQGSNKDYIQQLNSYLSKYNHKKELVGLQYLDSGVVYFHIGQTYRFVQHAPEDKMIATMDSILDVAARSKALLFDMRDYPDWGGFVYTLFRLTGKMPPKYGRYYVANKQLVGTYKLAEDRDTYYPPYVKPGKQTYKGKVVIIVNPVTRSMSEWNTMSLQTLFPQSITIGQQTSGADGDLKYLNLPGGYALPFTGNGIFYPDGTPAQRKGVKINIRVTPTVKEILSGKDILLEKAMKVIKQ
jgi:hypothetical protein